MAEDKIFADGFSFKRRENAPEFVIGRLSIKIEDAIAFLKAHADNGWCNLNLHQARTGNYYLELDTFKPGNKDGNSQNKKNYQPAAQADVENQHEDDVIYVENDEEEVLPF